ncbi:hypothetical protein PM082_016820 [Marasmius tenuissimus]|nr:hypothetical protein PM082_016820 [Marasmius tenuissimus]
MEQILLLLDPLDVGAVSQASHYFYDLIYSSCPRRPPCSVNPINQYLWRNLYLTQSFDNPTTCYTSLGRRMVDSEEGEEFDWKTELQEIMRARTIVESYTRRANGDISHSPKSITSDDRSRSLRTLLKLVTNVPPLRSSQDLLKDDKISANLMWVAAECRRGAFLDPISVTNDDDDDIGEDTSTSRQQRNMLGSVFGESPMQVDDDDDNATPTPTPTPTPAPETIDSFSETELQLRARLHTHLGLTPYDWTEEAILESRAYVYTMAHYTWGNDFGPFTEGWVLNSKREWITGVRVNWVHVHHIHRLVSIKILDSIPDEQLERFKELDVFIYQLSFPYTQIILSEEAAEREAIVREKSRKEKGKGKEKENNLSWLERNEENEKDKEKEDFTKDDWAGVTGNWKISFCFCDHGRLIRFNKALRKLQKGSSESSSTSTTSVSDYPPEASMLSVAEVLRTMSASLHITHIVQTAQFPAYPILYFGGEAVFGGGVNNVMTGWVRVIDDSGVEDMRRGKEDLVVRWHFVSGETGNPIWSGEGVQVGGIRSAYGILGAWTTIFHDEEDPVGPFWLRKEYDIEAEEDL